MELGIAWVEGERGGDTGPVVCKAGGAASFDEEGMDFLDCFGDAGVDLLGGILRFRPL